MRVIASGLPPETERQPIDPNDHRLDMTEKALQDAVIDMAIRLGWRHYHTHDSRRSPGGFPDLVLINKPRRRVIYAELKSTKGRVSRLQTEWHQDLADCQQLMFVWRPIDWITGAIENELRRR